MVELRRRVSRSTRGGRGGSGVHAAQGLLPEPVAGRLQRPSWRGGRLIVGVLLVVLAMTGGASALAHFDSTVEMLQASRTLVPGQTIGAGDVTSVKVRMDGAHAGYLKAGESLPRGQVVRAVQIGELVPTSAVGNGSAIRQKTIALPTSTGQSAILVAGSVVDLYVSAKQTATTGDTNFQNPETADPGGTCRPHHPRGHRSGGREFR